MPPPSERPDGAAPADPPARAAAWLPPSDTAPPAGTSALPPAPAAPAEWPGLPAPPVSVGRSTLPPGVEYAGFWQRVLGAVVDLLVRVVLVVVPMFVGALVLALVGGDTDIGLGIGAGLGAIAAFLVYAPYLMATRNGQTWGHSAAGIRVIHRTGAPITGGKAFVREVLVKSVLIEWVGASFCLLPTVIAYLFPLWDDQKQALHDKICDTLVVKA